MDRAKKIFSLVFLVGLVGLLGNAPASAASINGVAFDSRRGGIRIKLDGPGETTIRKLANPPRLLVDISNSSLFSGTRHIRVSDPRVKAVRVGQFSVVPAIVRVVIDLSGDSDVAPSIKKSSGEIFIALSGGLAIAEAKPIEKKKPVAKIALAPKAKPSAVKAVPIKIIKHTPPKPTPVPTPFLDEMPPVLPETPPTPLPTPKPLPTAMVLSTPAPVLATPTPEPTPSPVPQDGALPLSSLHLVWQQLDVQETYPILNADSTFSSNTTFGVLTDYRGLAWKHWVNDFFGFSLEGRLASFKLLDRLSSTSNDRTDTMAHPVVSFRYPLGTILPEASLGFLYRSTLVKPHADIAEDKSKYPSSANLSLMGPTLGAGVRFQIFKPLALLVGGYVTPFTMSSSSYEKEVQTNLSTFKLTPLGDSRMTIQALLDIAPMQFALGGYMEGISGKTTLDVPAYKQTNNGITLGVGFSY